MSNKTFSFLEWLQIRGSGDDHDAAFKEDYSCSTTKIRCRMSTFNGSCSKAIDCDNIKQEEKIDIVEEQLFFKIESLDEETRNKEFFVEFFKSVEVVCDICGDTKVQRVIKLNQQERVIGAILLKKIFKLGFKSHKIFHRKTPDQSCGRCFVHLISFKTNFKDKFLEYKTRKMHPASYNHGIECPCVDCKNQYGDLDLIVRGIETRSSPLLPSTITTMTNEEQQFDVGLQQQQESFLYPYNYESYSEQQTYSQTSYQVEPLPTMLQEFEPQPSTSHYQPHHESETPRKKSKKSCPHCNKQFNHTGDYRKHLRKHTKERPYACPQCDKKFSHTSNLHRHERSHSGDRPFKCDFCNKEFNRKDKLDSHRNSKACISKRSNK
ncbi:unnamed protein product [Ceutorhynchus assimilis]|uniref:C2H2-type domain-containing protein n=1 Tax=Ceutorhynchus assimilis TaxID=467358 RepID=A0A9N9N1E0_9CUCU|nr:unnamed protein product [Ceutorhynchus assimilis]